MAEIRVDAQKLESLVEKLQLANLTIDERQLLDALLAIAGNELLRTRPVKEVKRGSGTNAELYATVDQDKLTPLRDQLAKAFTSGKVPVGPDRPGVRLYRSIGETFRPPNIPGG